MGPSVSTSYVLLVTLRSLLARGYWLAAALYLVVEAGLTPLQLVVIGSVQAAACFLFEVPAGVVADTLSRKWSIVVACAITGTGMVATGLVTSFPLLVLTQVLWGVGWTFTSGADVAWLTDELNDEARATRTLIRGARWDQLGGAAGLVIGGVLGSVTSLTAVIIGSGAGLVLLGAFVAVAFPEHRFEAVRRNHLRAAWDVLRRGTGLARRDHEILLILCAAVLVNAAADGAERLITKRLFDLGFPHGMDPVAWMMLLGLCGMLAAALVLRIIEQRIHGIGAARRTYAAACALATIGLVVLATAPTVELAMLGVVLASGIAWSVVRAVGTIWINRRTTSDVRATVHSFLAQAEYIGEAALGLGIGVVAGLSTVSTALCVAAALVGGAGLLVGASRSDRAV